MNFTILSSVMTVISMIVFIGILVWAFSAKNKTRFEELAALPQDEENGK
ncbi:MAG: cbb3-type cytochrome c oxidase subunit 3 [Burkholderiales bacterium]|nr:cbb3-type cytochrome c oxidase subunit 3 [Burkholderiales bacterium]